MKVINRIGRIRIGTVMVDLILGGGGKNTPPPIRNRVKIDDKYAHHVYKIYKKLNKKWEQLYLTSTKNPRSMSNNNRQILRSVFK